MIGEGSRSVESVATLPLSYYRESTDDKESAEDVKDAEDSEDSEPCDDKKG